jgi:hypothetical protein
VLVAGAESSTRPGIARSGPEAFSLGANRSSAFRRRALAKALHYNELLIERLRARLEETLEPTTNRPGAANGTRPVRANQPSANETLTERTKPPTPRNGTAAPVVKPPDSPWLPPSVNDALHDQPLTDAMQFPGIENGDAARWWSSVRLRDPIRLVGSIPGRIMRFVREAPLAAATTVLAAAAAAAALLFASAHGGAAPRSHPTARPAALLAVPVASVPHHRHRRHHHRRHLRLPAITVPDSLAAPAAPSSVP